MVLKITFSSYILNLRLICDIENDSPVEIKKLRCFNYRMFS